MDGCSIVRPAERPGTLFFRMRGRLAENRAARRGAERCCLALAVSSAREERSSAPLWQQDGPQPLREGNPLRLVMAALMLLCREFRKIDPTPVA